MLDIIILLVMVGILAIAFSENASMLLSHVLNIVFRLPHPGPNDIQGSCWCRRHEGPSKYSFRDYINHLMS